MLGTVSAFARMKYGPWGIDFLFLYHHNAIAAIASVRARRYSMVSRIFSKSDAHLKLQGFEQNRLRRILASFLECFFVLGITFWDIVRWFCISTVWCSMTHSHNTFAYISACQAVGEKVHKSPHVKPLERKQEMWIIVSVHFKYVARPNINDARSHR
jgi:hypothetical protein